MSRRRRHVVQYNVWETSGEVLCTHDPALAYEIFEIRRVRIGLGLGAQVLSAPSTRKSMIETINSAEVAEVRVGETDIELPLEIGTENERAIDISKLREQTGVITLDEGYRNTGSVRSGITFINGEEGILRYRGIPIEQLAEKSSFIETALLLIYGELPTREHLTHFRHLLAEHEMIHEGMRNSFLGFPPSGHAAARAHSQVRHED